MTAPAKPNLRAIKRRWENASAGDWEFLVPTGFTDVTQVRTHTEHRTNDPQNPVLVKHTPIADYLSAADAEFMVHAHTDIPLLLADIEDWRKLTEKQLLQIVLVAGERDRLQTKLDALVKAALDEDLQHWDDSYSGPATQRLRDIALSVTAAPADIGELTPTWPCMECGADIKFRANPKLGGAVFQHLEEPDFPHYPVRGPQAGALDR